MSVVSAAPRAGGVMTRRWGWQPTAWMQDGLPTWRWRAAPSGLVTRRQMRERGLAPGGADPVAQVVCRGGRRRAWLYDPAELAPKRISTPAQLVAVHTALAARRWCPSCRRDVGYCIPTSLGQCTTCNFPDHHDADQHAGQHEAGQHEAGQHGGQYGQGIETGRSAA